MLYQEEVRKEHFFQELCFFIMAGFFLFSNFALSKSPDAIAMRIISNPDHYSALRWYNEKVTVKGSPQLLTVDGYPAVRDGRSVYVSAANVDTSVPVLYTNLYIISYNQEAEQTTQDIFGQILASWRFNINLDSSAGICSGLPTQNCLTDEECGGAGFCSGFKARVTRDTIRMARLMDLKQTLESYKKSKNRYPVLSAGSYLPAKTISVWPSWQETLAKELGATPPVDPINKMAACTGYNPDTCWDQTSKSFAWSADLNLGVIPDNNFVYTYSAIASGTSYRLCGYSESGLMDPVLACNGCVPAICMINTCGPNGCGTGNCPPGCTLPSVCSAGSCVINCVDIDLDGYDNCAIGVPGGDGSDIDCNNNDPAINPGALSCVIGANDNCNATLDCAEAGCTGVPACVPPSTCVDTDSDGYGIVGSFGCFFAGIDCDNTNAAINPGVVEICGNSIDEDCSGADLVCAPTCTDVDADGYGTFGSVGCLQPGVDCDDANGSINPGIAEICGNSIDEDCSGADLVCAPTCTDVDADGYGNPASAACPQATLDCDDTVSAINPGAAEICNGLDDNCNGSTDEGCNLDSDNYCSCSQTFAFGSDLSAVCPGTNSTNAGSISNTCDCNDSLIGGSTINPGAIEVCDNIDNNCKNGIDEACDDDDDNYCDAMMYVFTASVAVCPNTNVPIGTLGNDCNDLNSTINPGVLSCVIGANNNCNATLDCAEVGCASAPACVPPSVCVDDDSDGYDTCAVGAPGDDGNPADCDDADRNNWNTCSTCVDDDSDTYFIGCNAYLSINGPDCNDSNATAYPGAAEICDGLDNNCSTGIDEVCDLDNDNYCSCTQVITVGATILTCTNTVTTNASSIATTCDCDDALVNGSTINPGQTEMCSNSIDDNCNTLIDCSDVAVCGAYPGCTPACTFPFIFPCTF